VDYVRSRDFDDDFDDDDDEEEEEDQVCITNSLLAGDYLLDNVHAKVAIPAVSEHVNIQDFPGLRVITSSTNIINCLVRLPVGLLSNTDHLEK
jgi:hypothetical protein